MSNEEVKKTSSENKKIRKASFSNGIVNIVGLCFGIVFLVIFIFCIIVLLSQYKDDLGSYYSRVGILFGIFLLTYLGVSILVAKKIKGMIAPLDQLAYGLLDNKVKIYGDSDDISGLADGLKKEMLRLEKVSNELKETKENLDMMEAASAKNQEAVAIHSKNSIEAYNVILSAQESYEKDHKRLMELRDDIRPVEDKLRASRKNMITVVKTTDTACKDGLKNVTDSLEDILLAKNAEETMQSMLDESIELIENLYNDLSYMQDMMNKLTLSASNSSLELVRTGAFGMSTAASADEIGKLTTEISAKNDEATLLSIRIKNSIKLAREQAAICENKLSDGKRCLEENEEVLKLVSANSSMSREGFEISANAIGLIMEKIYDISEIFERQNETIDNLKDKLMVLEKELGSLASDVDEE